MGSLKSETALVILLGIFLFLLTLELEKMNDIRLEALNGLRECLENAELDILHKEGYQTPGPTPFSYDVREDSTRKTRGGEYVLITVYVLESLLKRKLQPQNDNPQIFERHKMIREVIDGFQMYNRQFKQSDVKINFVITDGEQPLTNMHSFYLSANRV